MSFVCGMSAMRARTSAMPSLRIITSWSLAVWMRVYMERPRGPALRGGRRRPVRREVPDDEMLAAMKKGEEQKGIIRNIGL